MIFREAVTEDIPEMAEIRLLVNENVLSDPALITTQMYEDYLDKLGKGWVCEDNGKIIGFSYACKTDSSIWALFIRPEYQGKGVGKQLLKLAVDWLFSSGSTKITLSTEAHTRADKFYTSQGWRRGMMKDSKEVYFTLSKDEI